MNEDKLKELNLNERQIERIKLLAKIAGSIKTPYKIDATEEINYLRGKK